VGYEGLERRMDLLHSSSGVSGPWSPVDGWTDLPVQAGGIDFPVVLEGNSGFYRLRVRLQ